MSGAPDPDVLERAARDGRVVVSHDKRSMTDHLDTRLARGSHSPGVIIVEQSVPVGVAIDELVYVIQVGTPADFADTWTYLPLR